MAATTTDLSTAPETASRGCTKCAKRLDTNGFPLWCKACRAEYRRDYEACRKEMAESRGFAAGVGAAREFFATKFAALGYNTFTGIQAAQWVRSEPGPVLPSAD